MSAESVSGAARIYALADPARVKAGERAILQILYQTLRITNPAGHRVRVSPASGAIEYVNTLQLWRKGPPPDLPNGEVARMKAETFLRELKAAFAGGGRSRIPESLSEIVLLPPLKPVDIILVPRPDRPAGDHWLYRCQPQLSLLRDERRMANVFGALIEVCIGEAGQVIAFRSQWRPVTAEHVFADLTPFQAPRDDHGNSGHREHASAPQLVYVLDGECIPQYYLAPYYLSVETEHFRLSSAGRYSLAVGLGIQETPEGTAITAIPEGGSGQYAFQWAAVAIDDPWESHITELGPGYTVTLRPESGGEIHAGRITIRPGAYLIMINVKDRDRRTGAFKHHQQHVYSFPRLQDEPQAASRVS